MAPSQFADIMVEAVLQSSVIISGDIWFQESSDHFESPAKTAQARLSLFLRVRSDRNRNLLHNSPLLDYSVTLTSIGRGDVFRLFNNLVMT